MLALNLVHRSFLGLLTPLDYDQGAPIGFLLLQKAVLIVLGGRDYTLRLVPLMASLGSIIIMYYVSSEYLIGSARVMSLCLFVLSPNLIHYSSEMKQYSSDVLMALLLMFIVPQCLAAQATPHALVALGLAGCLAIWISHPTFFVLLGVSLALALAFARRRDPYRLVWLTGIGAAWGVNLTLAYLISLRYLASNAALLDSWSGSFAPLPPWSHLGWYYNALIGVLSDSAELPFGAINVALLILGAFSFAFRRWDLMLVLMATYLSTLIASALGMYPFSGRLLLFLIPLLLLLLAEGVERARTILLRVSRPMAWLVSTLLIGCLLYDPIIAAYRNLQSPPMGEHIKPVMAHIHKGHLSADLISELLTYPAKCSQ